MEYSIDKQIIQMQFIGFCGDRSVIENQSMCIWRSKWNTFYHVMFQSLTRGMQMVFVIMKFDYNQNRRLVFLSPYKNRL